MAEKYYYVDKELEKERVRLIKTYVKISYLKCITKQKLMDY